MVGYLAHADERHSLTTEFIAMQYAQVSFTIVSRYLLLTTPTNQIQNMDCILRTVLWTYFTPQLRHKTVLREGLVISHQMDTIFPAIVQQ